MSRRRPMLTITVEPETRARLDALVAKLPGGTLSGLVEELLVASLPAFEQMADAFIASRDESGAVNEKRAREQVAAWIGTQIMRATDPDDDLYNAKGGGRSVGNAE